jgi:hypothetical protein
MDNPYFIDQLSQQTASFGDAARMIPGTRPDIGVLAGTGEFVNLMGGSVIDPSDYGEWGIDPLTLAYGRVAASGPVTPSFTQAREMGLDISGRGYNYGAAPTAEELALEQAFLAGDVAAGQQLAAMRSQQIQANDPSTMQSIASQFYAPLIVSAAGLPLGFAGGAAGALAGAGYGALSSGAMTGWEDPAAIALGTAGGALGGWGGSQAAGAMGFGPTMTGVSSGVGSALGSGLGTSAATGEFDADALARNVVIGGATGALGGYLGQPEVDETGKPMINPATNKPMPSTNPFASWAATNALGSGLRYLLPDFGLDDSDNPYQRRGRR